MLCRVRSHRDQGSGCWLSNQRQPDKNAPSVDNGPAFLLASVLFFLAERKKVSSPPPTPPAPSRLCPPRQAPAQIPRRAKPRRDRADPTWEPGTHTHTSRPPAGDPACPSRPASGTPISALPREGGRGAASRCVGLQGFGGAMPGRGGPAGCPWAAPSPVSVCGEALRGGGRSGATRSPCGPQPPAGSRLPSSPLRWRKIQPQPGTAPASPREGRRGAAAAESPL
ncbi:unnamed protein product, partial [Bubo scandiacus]